jgi:hypothetical protein
VEERRREELGDARVVPVLAVREVPLHDGGEGVVLEHRPAQAVEEGGEAGDGGREDEAARLQDAAGLRERGDAVGAVRQVVERAEHQHGVRARVRERQVARVAHPGAGQPSPGPGPRGFLGLPHVERDRVHEVDLVPGLREPEGVRPRGAAHVEDDAGRRWQVPPHQLPRPRALEGKVRLIESAALAAPGVVAQDLVGRAGVAQLA